MALAAAVFSPPTLSFVSLTFFCNFCPKYVCGYHLLQNRILGRPLVRRDLLAMQLPMFSHEPAAPRRFPASLGEALTSSVKKIILYSSKCHGPIVNPSNRDSLFLHFSPSSRNHTWILFKLYVHYCHVINQEAWDSLTKNLYVVQEGFSLQ